MSITRLSTAAALATAAWLALAPAGCARSGGSAATSTGSAQGTNAMGGQNAAAGRGGNGAAPLQTSGAGGIAEGTDAGSRTTGSAGNAAGRDGMGGESSAARGAVDGPAGLPGTAGSSAGGGAPETVPAGAGGVCGGCQIHESCWSDLPAPRCVERAVSVPASFGIDSTEVTRGQYRAWLATNPSTGAQGAACAWNGTFAPDVTCMAKASVCQGDTCANHPQPCIDMCDAAAYCGAIGRRLCTADDWVVACSSTGTYAAGYGPGPVIDICNDYTVAAASTVPVASKPGCHPPAGSPFDGVFDMIGNVAEWVDDCSASTGATDVCRPRGLSFGNGAAAPICAQYTYAKRSAALDNLGFRCCGT
jgi:formylglycine-generating enzyme